MKGNNPGQGHTKIIPPREVAEKVARRNGNTDVTPLLPGPGKRPPPARVPPQRRPETRQR